MKSFDELFAQLSERAVRPQGQSQPAWKLVAGLASRLGHDLGYKRVADVQAALAPQERSGAAVQEAGATA